MFHRLLEAADFLSAPPTKVSLRIMEIVVHEIEVKPAKGFPAAFRELDVSSTSSNVDMVRIVQDLLHPKSGIGCALEQHGLSSNRC